MSNFVDTEAERHARCMNSVNELIKQLMKINYDDMPDIDWWSIVHDAEYDPFDAVEAALESWWAMHDLSDAEFDSLVEALDELRKQY